MNRVHGIQLPDFEASDTFKPAAYMDSVAEAVSAKADWSVQQDDIALGFFSFSKFLMYRDLDPETWPHHGRISERPLIRNLLGDGFVSADDMIWEDAKIDPIIAPQDMLHIVDSDSSQMLAIHEVRRGRDLVIQGPPGTGKSQTIANVIASAVADGKTVLFVAEKMAALEVVKRRLDATGVGVACLELHSNKANKRALLDELRRTWELGAPKALNVGALYARLTEARNQLNAHVARMHSPHPKAGLTPYQIIGQLARLRLAGERPNDIALDAPHEWTGDDFSDRYVVLSELIKRVDAIGKPVDHIWYGTGLASITPMDVERLAVRILALEAACADLEAQQAELSGLLECEDASTLEAISPSLDLAHRLSGAPDLSGKALTSPVWADPVKVQALIENGSRYTRIRNEIASAFIEGAWGADVTEDKKTLQQLPLAFTTEAFERLAFLGDGLPRLKNEADALASIMGLDVLSTLADVQHLIKVGERVAAAPEADADAFAADLWNTNVDHAADLANAVRVLEQARAEIGDKLQDAAWTTDLLSARTTLASHGEDLFKILNGEWRKANRLVRSMLLKPDQSLTEILKLLDALARGQSARRLIEKEEALGRSIFASHWRGDRSNSKPITTLVEWMQSLKGLGADPRLVAARRPDLTVVAARVERTRKLLANLLPAIYLLWDELPEKDLIFADALSADRADLVCLLESVAQFNSADQATAAILLDEPVSLSERLERLDKLVEGQACAQALVDGDATGRDAFDVAWNTQNSDWDALNLAASWIISNSDIRLLTSRIDNRSALARRADAVEHARSELIADLNRLFDDIHFDLPRSMGTSSITALPLGRLRVRLGAWARGGEQLSKWVAYRDRADRGRVLGCGDVVARLEDGRLGPQEVIPAFEMAYYEAVHADQVRTAPEIGRFDGTLHSRIASEFADLDRQRIAWASAEVVNAHHKRVPPKDGGVVGPVGVLRAEMQKKRGYMPIRKLMERAGPAVQALKPVFMMSPLSVAQFLPAGVFDFDLLVMDEASQIQPVDALGAIARAKQVVVVGDPKQLPPTAFFAKMTGNADDDDDEGNGRVGDIESILGLFTARGFPMRMLRWHYRSKHQSLIAVSNCQFYESKLFIVPSPYTAEAGMGLRFHHIPDGVFDAGGTRTNQVEAKVVARAIIDHAQHHPELSLGVAAFSTAQRRAILDQLEMLRRNLPAAAEAFFQDHPAEPFFVKNLENVQGDERDVIFISVGYGPTTPGGRVLMRFGPLGTEGGERRLNVLISRAKQRCEVFASMTDEDIEPDFAQTRKGVFAFRLFLHFARTGQLTMAESTGRDHDSVFEEQVAKALQARGYQVHRQVGLAGFFIDLAVADAERPGRYLLGIECDGASYHDARSARDRDRLRQSVLESHGWTIHRVWSTDWFQRPKEQLDLIIARIEAAKTEHDAKATRRSRAIPFEIMAIERENVTEIGLIPSDDISTANAYLEADLKRPTHSADELHETSTGILAFLIEEVVRIEGPVHIDEVIVRIRNAWGLKKAGSRIRAAVEAAVTFAVNGGRITRSENFLSIPGAPIRVRDRSEVASTVLRQAEMLPPAEIRAAILDIVNRHLGATRDQMVQAVSRAFGIRSISAAVREAIEKQVDEALSCGDLTIQGDMLIVNETKER